MKRFLVSFIIGMTLLAAGVTTLIFELRDFRFVDASSEEIEQNSLSDEITIGKEDVKLYFDDGMSYDIHIDDTVKDNVIQLMQKRLHFAMNELLCISAMPIMRILHPFMRDGKLFKRSLMV